MHSSEPSKNAAFNKVFFVVNVKRKWQQIKHIFSFRLDSDFHTAFNPPYVYDCITKLCRQYAEVIQNHEKEHVRSIGQGEARHRKYKRLKLGGVQAHNRSCD
jgi:hypothetical protein